MGKHWEKHICLSGYEYMNVNVNNQLMQDANRGTLSIQQRMSWIFDGLPSSYLT